MSLYHRYRPQRFIDVVGQQYITQTISNQLKNDRVGHAYLFAGPRGVGKTTTARILARAINCTNLTESAEPCNTCESCTRITDGKSIDIIEIDAASHTGVENVRQNIIENAQFRPSQAQKKVFIIDEVHMLSTSAFNALLKTLEEPPAYVLFVMATTELHKVPETIISRCQRFAFKKIPPHEMKEELKNISKTEKITIDDKVLDRIVQKSDGCMRDSVTLLDQLMSSGETHITAQTAALFLPMSNYEHIIGIVSHVFAKNSSAALAEIKSSIEQGTAIRILAEEIIQILRYILLFQSNPDVAAQELDVSQDQKNNLTQLSAQITPADLVPLIELFMKRSSQMYQAPLPSLPIEMAIVEWCDKDKTTAEIPTTSTPTPPTKIEKTSSNADLPKKKIAEEKPTPPAPTIASVKASKKDTPVTPKKKKETKQTESDEKKSAKNEVKTSSEEISDTIIQTAWNQVKTSLSSEHPTLSIILSSTTAKHAGTDLVTLTVTSAFHEEKLSQGPTKTLINDALNETLATSVHLEIKIAGADTTQKNGAEEPSIDELAQMLGGDVVA